MPTSHPRTFVINLDRDSERMEWMWRELDRIGLIFERVPGLTCDTLPGWIRDQFFAPGGEPYGALSQGEIGCYASHLSIMKKIVDENYRHPVLVLEDDLRIDMDLLNCIEDIESTMGEWDIIRLSNRAKSPYFSCTSLGCNREVVRYWRVPNNTGAYLINLQGAKKFLQAYSRRTQAIDEELRRPWKHHLRTYGVEPAPVASNIFASSIEEMGVRSDLTPDIKRRKIRHALELFSKLRYVLEQFGLPGCIKVMLRRVSLLYMRKVKRVSKQDLDFRLVSDLD